MQQNQPLSPEEAILADQGSRLAVPRAWESDRDPQRRSALRAAVKLTGDMVSPMAAYTANVSETGMFVALSQPPPVGSWLLFEMAFGMGPEDRVRGMGTVVWTPNECSAPGENQGMGFEFRSFSGDGLERLREAISRFEARAHPSSEQRPQTPGPKKPESVRRLSPVELLERRYAAAKQAGDLAS